MKVNRNVRAAEELAPEVAVAPEASDLLFEAEDVAELVAEVTGQPVDVVAEEDTVTFTVGDQEFTVEAEGDEEVVESSVRFAKGKKPVSAARKPAPVKAPVKASARVFRKLPSGR